MNIGFLNVETTKKTCTWFGVFTENYQIYTYEYQHSHNKTFEVFRSDALYLQMYVC